MLYTLSKLKQIIPQINYLLFPKLYSYFTVEIIRKTLVFQGVIAMGLDLLNLLIVTKQNRNLTSKVLKFLIKICCKLSKIMGKYSHLLFLWVQICVEVF